MTGEKGEDFSALPFVRFIAQDVARLAIAEPADRVHRGGGDRLAIADAIDGAGRQDVLLRQTVCAPTGLRQALEHIAIDDHADITSPHIIADMCAQSQV